MRSDCSFVLVFLSLPHDMHYVPMNALCHTSTPLQVNRLTTGLDDYGSLYRQPKMSCLSRQPNQSLPAPVGISLSKLRVLSYA